MRPVLRFKEFTNDWGMCKLGDVCMGFDYGIGASATDFDGIHKYIRITDIDENSHKYIGNPIVSPDCIPERKYLVNTNDILFARTGASTGKTYLYNEKDFPLYFAGFLIRFNVNKANPSFIFYNTLTRNYNNWVKLTSARSGQPGINSEELKNYSFECPSIEEQTKIATFLNLYYKKIELQKKKIEQLEKLSFDALFTHKYDGKTYNLEQVLTEVNERTTQNNQYEVISSTKAGLYYQKDYFNKEIASEDNSGYKILKLNQVVISPQNLWLGNINYNDSIEIGIVSPSYKIFNINEGFNKTFISHLLKSKRAMYDYMISSEQGASVVRRNLNIELFNEIIFRIPDIETQNHIAHQLVLINNKINLEKQKLEAMETYKQGLLQQLFV